MPAAGAAAGGRVPCEWMVRMIVRMCMLETQDKGYKGKGMEGRIAYWYAKNTRKDMAEFRALAERLAQDLPAGSRVLEVAPGPGYLAIELAKRGTYAITGLDISETFVDIATENAWNDSVKVTFQEGNAAAMPFADASFDFIVCRAAFKNFSQPVRAFDEMQRVLKPGGRALIIDLRKDASMDDINAYIKGADLGWMNALIYKLTFRYMLLPRAYSKQQFMLMAASSRFGGCEVLESGIGFEVVLRK
jgi:ubiquinone/menaquinone biosynthesis C-methylase UbiE